MVCASQLATRSTCVKNSQKSNAAHTLAYSIVALQEMNLAYKYPIIYWDTANLIVDSGAINLSEEMEDDVEDEEEDNEEEKKVKNSSTDYGKIAAAIGKMKTRGLKFSLPDINKSALTFSPLVEQDVILYGLRGITRIGNQLIKDIFNNRPYENIEDFLSKVKINKTQMVSLLKAGCFDNLYPNSNRSDIMNKYLDIITETKKRITLQNMKMLIEKDLIPDELDFERRLYNFNKYLKNFKEGNYYILNDTALGFYNKYYDDSLLVNQSISEEGAKAYISQTKWDSIYKKGMDAMRVWMKSNQEEILNKLNAMLKEDNRIKYCDGNISKWEMDSLSFYYHEHELDSLHTEIYDIDDYNKLENNELDRSFTTKSGDEIQLFKIHRIAGTVIDKNKNKSTVTLLTTSGVVTVKIWKNQFAIWDKQISEKGADGKKHVLEKSWFQRGNKLIITGMKRDDTFIPKKYKSTSYPLFTKINKLENGFITEMQTERIEVDE